jgi:isoquinoline 1-oxidoreductase alpha subunit
MLRGKERREIAMIEFELNGRAVSTDADASMPLLWWLRDIHGLTGTKYGCGIGACGACTVHIDGEPGRACLSSLGSLEGRKVITIEGLAHGAIAGTPAATALHVVQRAWMDHDVAQCGYCQAGQIMSAAALLSANPRPDEAAIDAAMAGNLCRCGTYPRIRAALRAVAAGEA